MPGVLLVDDHPLFHEGLASAFARLAPDLRIVSAESVQAGLELLRQSPNIELALVDLILPTSDGLTALALYAQEFPHIPRVLISGKEDPAIVRRARDAGASGFIHKSMPLDRLLAVLRRVLDGHAYFELGAKPLPEMRVSSTGEPHGELTLRQLEVLKLLGEGRSNKEISAALAIADRTVRAHLTELFRTLKVASRTQAILAAQRLGLLGGAVSEGEAALRQEPQASVSAARQREIRTECVRTMYRQTKNSRTAALGVTLYMVVTLWRHVPHALIAYFLGLQALLQAHRVWIFSSYRRAQLSVDNSELWGAALHPIHARRGRRLGLRGALVFSPREPARSNVHDLRPVWDHGRRPSRATPTTRPRCARSWCPSSGSCSCGS